MHVSFVLRDEVTNVLDRPDRTDIRVGNQALLAVGGANQEELRFCYQIPGYFAFVPQVRKDGVHLFCCLFDLWVT